MTSQILPEWWTPSGLAAAQAALLTKATTDDAAIQACTGASAAFKTGWASFLATLRTFCTTDYGWLTTTNADGTWSWGGGTGETATQLQDYAEALYQWELAAQKQSCALVGPVTDPNTLPPATDALVALVKYGSIAAAFLATAYAVGRVSNAFELARAAEPRAASREHRSR
jgi:hypothetical protein